MLAPPTGPRLLLQLQDGTQVSSANEMCRLLSVQFGARDMIGGADPIQGALVDYWLEWEGRELKVCIVQMVPYTESCCACSSCAAIDMYYHLGALVS